MLDALLPPAESGNFLGPDITEAIFLSALTWSLGGGLLEDGRIIFDQLIKRLASMPQNPAEGAAVGPGKQFLSSVTDLFVASHKADIDESLKSATQINAKSHTACLYSLSFFT